jgi:hypothetical protein
MHNKFVKLLAVLAAMYACVYNTSATVYYKIGGTSDLQSFNVKFDNTSYTVNAGGIQISQTGTGHSVNNTMPLNYVTVCTDFLGSLYVGSTYSYDSPAVSFNGQTGIAPAWNNPALAIQNAAKIFYTYGQLSSTGIGGTVQNMAAVQLAVWISLYDTTSTGQVVVNNASIFQISTSSNNGNDTAAITEALNWVATLNGSYNYAGYLLKPDPLNSQGNKNGHDPQELLIAVPEPATIAAAILLLLPLGVGTIRMLRKSARQTPVSDVDRASV